MNLKELRYTKDHEWVKLDGGEAVVGITDHAQSELGDITFVDLPKKGKKVKQSDSISTIESVKAASDVYSPVSGEITAVNEKLADEPEKINKSPYGDGWICRVAVLDKNEVNKLMTKEEYDAYLKK
ncbi:MAG TPA: glycine cleavage system protein GcvH [Candidatus Omnitrophota bacterium]|nr:glycine cleavage system protein GcvH [Candidatus Omnitrophota bacterium]